MHSASLRVGVLLQFGSLISNLILFALFLHLNTGGNSDDSYNKWVDVYLPLLLAALNAASFIVLSYGIGGWQKTRDPIFTVLQVVFSGIVVVLLASTVHLGGQPDDDYWLQVLGGSAFLLWSGVAATLFAAAVFLLRPGRWKQHRVLTLLIVVGIVLFAPQGPGGYLVLEHWFPSFLALYRVLYTTSGLSYLLFMLGILVLIQTERVRKKARQVIPAPALLR